MPPLPALLLLRRPPHLLCWKMEGPRMTHCSIIAEDVLCKHPKGSMFQFRKELTCADHWGGGLKPLAPASDGPGITSVYILPPGDQTCKLSRPDHVQITRPVHQGHQSAQLACLACHWKYEKSTKNRRNIFQVSRH